MTTTLTIFEEKGAAISEASQKLIAEIKNIKISDENSQQLAIDARERVRVCLKRIDELRTQGVKPLNDEVKNINAQAKFYAQPLEGALEGVTNALKKYMDMQARKAEEQARKLREEQEEKDRIERQKIAAALKRQEELEAAKAKASTEERIKLEQQAALEAQKAAEAQAALDAPVVQLVESAPKSVRTATGASITRKMKWTFAIEDLPLLAKAHPELILANEVAIRKLITGGERTIAGVRIFQESQLSA